MSTKEKLEKMSKENFDALANQVEAERSRRNPNAQAEFNRKVANMTDRELENLRSDFQ
jgi:hypothetical protein